MDYIKKFINREKQRQSVNVELIASENYPSRKVKKIMSSCLTSKYCEGYPEQSSLEIFQKKFPKYVHTGKTGRYYGGCENVDQIELYCKYMFQKAFKTDYHVNVQPHSGSQANYAAYQAILKPGDTVLAMSLNDGGHLTHGSKANFSGKLFNCIFYNLDENGYIDYNDIYNKMVQYKPKVIVAGASAYSRTIDFERIYNIIQKVKSELNESEEIEYEPYFMVDMAHIAGLVAAGLHVSPFGYADIITTTTHKTLR